MNEDELQSHGQPSDSVNPPPAHRPPLLEARLVLVKLVLVWFLMFWPPDPRRQPGGAVGRCRAGEAEEKESTLKGDDAKQRGRPDGLLRQSRRRHRGRGRLVHSLMTVCTLSTIIATSGGSHCDRALASRRMATALSPGKPATAGGAGGLQRPGQSPVVFSCWSSISMRLLADSSSSPDARAAARKRSLPSLRRSPASASSWLVAAMPILSRIARAPTR